jgi:hypothetical protein
MSSLWMIRVLIFFNVNSNVHRKGIGKYRMGNGEQSVPRVYTHDFSMRAIYVWGDV